jgi:hypothetical protein
MTFGQYGNGQVRTQRDSEWPDAVRLEANKDGWVGVHEIRIHTEVE